jgi:hypothetical protein
MNVCRVYLIFAQARYELKVVLRSPLARKCKDEFPDFINIPLADFFMDNLRHNNEKVGCENIIIVSQ